MDNPFRVVIFSSIIAFTILSFTVSTTQASEAGPLERMREIVGEMGGTLDTGDDSSGNSDDATSSGKSTLSIPNITQREEAPVSAPSGSIVSTDEFAMNAEFEPHENEFLADENYWQMDAFGFNVTPNSSICPTGNCEFEFEDGQINTDFRGDWVLTGRLKVGVETEEGTRSKLYDVRGELDRKETLERENSVTDMLGGEFRLGSGPVILPDQIDVEYEITNGSLTIEDEDASLILQGTKQ
ncbi:MAG TPA: hypothetical protein VE130_01280 [Nitrososphaeraceae archaeon]|nr:hypothetical protein [Nitrososphaeraceae archaeon]